MKRTNIKAVIFDLDGTLYDKKRITLWTVLVNLGSLKQLKATNRTRKSLKGIDLKTASAWSEQFYGKSSAVLECDVEVVKDWYEKRFYPRFVSLLKRFYTARKGLGALMEAAAGKIPLVVFSDYSHVEERLKALKLNPGKFVILESSESYGALKPSPRPLLDIAERLNCDPSQVLVVGDRDDTDGEAARMAGMPFCHITGREAWSDFIADFLKNITKEEEK